jgi:geranylgeranylglycerol-phosphate geranylgeranyltransferase
MTGIGTIIGAIIASGLDLQLFDRTFFFSFITGFSLTGASMAINDYVDQVIDAINEPQRPLPKGDLRPIDAIIITAVLSIIGLISALLTCFQCFILAIFAWTIMIFYSLWGKRTGFLGNLMVSLCVSLPIIYGGVLVKNIDSILLFSVLAFLSNTGREITKGIADIEGDRIAGINTIAVSFGVNAAAWIAIFFYFFTVTLSMTPYIFNLVSIWYLPFIIFTDLLIISGSLKLLKKPNKENSILMKNRVLYGMMLALLGFLVGRLF